MGQQQLLLVILVTIIVGIATVVAINTFGSAADSANVDAVRQDLSSMAAAAQGYFMKPQMLGGGGNKFDGLTMSDLNCPGDVNSEKTECSNENGTYTIGTPSDDSFIISAVPSSAGGDIEIEVFQDDAEMGDWTASE